MKDARGLDVSANDPAAVAAADDFAARLLRLDQGVEGILEAAKHWPGTSIIQLYAAAFWLYGQTDGARETAAAHLRTCEALAMNGRERALHRALALWHGNDNLCAVEALEAITAEWPGDLLTAKLAEFLYYVLGQQFMGPRFRAHMRRLEPAHAEDPGMSRPTRPGHGRGGASGSDRLFFCALSKTHFGYRVQFAILDTGRSLGRILVSLL